MKGEVARGLIMLLNLVLTEGFKTKSMMTYKNPYAVELNTVNLLDLILSKL